MGFPVWWRRGRNSLNAEGQTQHCAPEQVPDPACGRGILPEEATTMLNPKKEPELGLEREGVSVSGRGNRIGAQTLVLPLPSHLSTSWVSAVQGCYEDQTKPWRVMAQGLIQDKSSAVAVMKIALCLHRIPHRAMEAYSDLAR